MSKPTKIELLNEIDALDDHVDGLRAQLAHANNRITEAFERINKQDEAINALRAATTHKPYYVPNPAPYIGDVPYTAPWWHDGNWNHITCDSKTFPVNERTVDL